MLCHFLILLPFSLLSVLYLLNLFKGKKLNLPPSPPKLPLIGNLHQIGTLPHRSFRTLSAKYGPLMLFYFGKAPALIVSSAEAAAQIMKTHDIAFSGRPPMMATDVLAYGSSDVAFCPYGDYWKQVKKICVHELLSQKQVQAFQFVREEVVADMVEKIRLSCLKGAAIDLSDVLLSVANDTISRSAFGRVYETEGGDKNLGKLTRRVVDLIGGFCLKDFFPSLGWIDVLTGLVARLNGTFQALDQFFDQVIEEHEKDLGRESDKHNKEDLVDILLHLQKEGIPGMDLTRDNLKAILLDMFVAGTDSTTAAMEWAMAELVKNPVIMKKVQEEIRGVVGEKTKICEADIGQTSHLRNILKETFRLHAPFLIVRETSTDVKLEGYDIPPKTRVLINAWAIQRDPKVWDRPEEFIPDRFANTSVDFKGQHGHFIPFGGGRRMCPGIPFAVAEIELVLANLLYWFDWTIPRVASPENMDMDEVNSLAIRRKTHLLLVPEMRCL